ncbi:MAG TPA: hypothetical protein VFO31_18190 [Vicinamibacterales bacterium]|nr:hypothetical protein [Vicinamibacterales bacterium]
MKLWIVAAGVLALAGSVSAQVPTVTASQHAADEDRSSTTDIVFPGWFAGRWTAPPFEVSLSSDFHRSVYGPNARSVRQVMLTIRPSGDGTFTVTNSVRDRSGKTVPGTRQIDEVTFTIGDLKREPGYQPRYTSQIVKAERRYPDDPTSTFPLDGTKLELFVPEGKTGALDVRFDTPDGRGSFWETLRPAARPAARKAG